MSESEKVFETRAKFKENSTKIFTSNVSITLVVIGIISSLLLLLTPEIKDVSKTEDFLKIYIPISILVFIVFILLDFIYNRFLKKLAEFVINNHVELDKVNLQLAEHIKLAADIPVNIQSQLESEIETAKELVSAIKDLASPHLIHWTKSSELELNAKKVYSISNDFSWLSNKDQSENVEQLFRIIYDAIIHQDDLYYFMAVNVTAEQNIIRFRDILAEINVENSALNLYVTSKIKNNNNKELTHYKSSLNTINNRILFRSIFKIPYYKDKVGKSFIPLPVPTDIVLYLNTRLRNESNDVSYLVLSTVPVADAHKVPIMEQYDAVFKHTTFIQNIQLWFDATWKEIGNYES